MGLNSLLEIISVVFGTLYLILMVRENIWCWIFGILASAITVYLYIHVTLYLEAGLNVYYILAGFYGWHYWANNQKVLPATERELLKAKNKTPVITWRPSYHIITIISCGLLSTVLGYVMAAYTDSERPYIDAFLTVFSFVATYMEAKKVLSTWYYWFFLNAGSVFLQIDRGLYYFAILSVFYTVMCVYGYKRWLKSYRDEPQIISDSSL